MRLSRLLYRISMVPILEDNRGFDDYPCFDDYNPKPTPERGISRAEIQLLFGKELGGGANSATARSPAMTGGQQSSRKRQPSNLPYLLRASASV